ncbi:acetyl-CoA synthetase-like protein [Macrolepiota fuliginosa MF-IS2]|uniref:Acetyl-CoA synthetase-like protein n=1 Tax=Macrolepiota fuliginosa MF-IS2 TaxID=1400762 RepID=A0A9P6BZX8_9AGAR|nr:acetyl-CoA synthetase-like protein [Macrolepiota fuliginosa MF-IS2]
MDSPAAFQTLPDLLLDRSVSSTAGLSFLDNDGNVTQSISYTALYSAAQDYARRLLLSGIRPDGTNVIIASFESHHDHILLFWACCLAGVPFCPIPPLHPEESRRVLFLNHLQTLFSRPILIASDETISTVQGLVPSFEATSWSHLDVLTPGHDLRELPVYPKSEPQPDDVVCFMLTSGSTGNSKAVSLRHSNFLSCVRGKIRHHGSDSSSRFLNWIAFDHVACVSEIHLQALMANAWQYHVSPAAIIRNPRNLLEWTSKYQVTYTFSPNFLIAQLVRDFTSSVPINPLDLSSVRAFISGGEAVPVKTAVEFTDILTQLGARRDVLRAGFGMTETCAGCIYDTRDILTDASQYSSKYLSLGSCCDGVTMRVVDHITGLPCSPLKEGQLQITGPSVFREYHNNPKATAESFSNGWFITGDTAVIDDDGNLHLMGRDKDCININGVKHPTSDVEHFIEDSHVDGVLRSYVYVCPMRLANADTETYGVFYQHELQVEDGLSTEGLARLVATNHALRRACVLFCSQSPHIVLPLPRSAFVKTALGKVSRSFLAAAYLKGTYEEIEHKLENAKKTAENNAGKHTTHTEEVILASISELFNIPYTNLTCEMNLFDLGASSMHLMQLKQILQERLRIADIPTIEMLRRPEINLLASFIDTILIAGDRNTVPYDPLVLLNAQGSKPPLFLVHPGVGEILIFIKLAQVLNDDRPVYALRARGFEDKDKPFETFDGMVECYTERILAAYSQGPYYVAGYSFGGAVAFEITKKLEAQGKRVAWTGVLNLPPEIQFRMNELVWLEVFINLLMFLALVPTSAFEQVKWSAIEKFPELQGADSEPETSAEVIRYLLSLSDQNRLTELQLNFDDLRRWVAVAYQVTCTGRTYLAEGSITPALMTVFCAIPLPSLGTREEYKQQRLSRWQPLTKSPFEMIDVDGEHYTMISEEHVSSFAEKLRATLARATDLSKSKLDPSLQALPIIDFPLSYSNNKAYLQQLRDALESVGFGILINAPGFEESFQRETLTLTEQLFSKPQEWKDSLSIINSSSFRGYFHVGDKVILVGVQ